MVSNTLYPLNDNEPIFNTYNKEEIKQEVTNHTQALYFSPLPPVVSNMANTNNELLQDELNRQMNGIYLQTPKSASSPIFQSFSNIIQTSPEQQVPNNILPITPNINSSPSFITNSGEITHNVYMSNFDTPHRQNKFNTSNLGITEEIPAGLGIANVSFSSEEVHVPQMISSENIQHQQVVQLGNNSFSNYEQDNISTIKNLDTDGINVINTSVVDNLKSQNHMLVNNSVVSETNENSFNIEASFTQENIDLEDFLCKDPFESSTTENNESSSDSDHVKLTKLGNPLDMDSNIDMNESVSGESYFNVSSLDSDKNSVKKTKKKSLSTPKIAPKRILKKSSSFNGNLIASSNTNSLTSHINYIGHHPKVDQSFSFNDCSNTFAINMSSNYSFILENDNVYNNVKRVSRSNSKSERPVLKHSSTFMHFDSSMTKKNSPKVLKNMKSGMGMFQIDFNGTNS